MDLVACGVLFILTFILACAIMLLQLLTVVEIFLLLRELRAIVRTLLPQTLAIP